MKRYKPITPGRRGMTTVSYRGVLTAKKPSKKLSRGVKRAKGRNSAGRITAHHRGGGTKRLYRDIDFKYEKKNVEAKVLTIEYDPNRSGFIGLVSYKDGDKRYVLLPKSIKAGQTFIVSEEAPIKAGNRLPLNKIPVGTFVYNIELRANGGAKLVRSAGNYAEVVANDGTHVHLKMPSGEIRKIVKNAWASVGEVSNPEYKLVNLGKAGRNRWLGRRPKVRGSAMNPVDHPHGGGEGRGGRGRKRQKTKQGKMVGKGQKSRRPKKYSNSLIVSRRKVGKKK
ncbi:MAG TPA: 50S ribosomal protein L2 [Candidatus Paceibacterota bacterium]|jgi:large subunit ribosomal protein L2|nr:50S ribosomal protein L2 [Parcubacteria group bacterium]HJN62716.1 50S ribosomal protein L2 [Candidatus Paceibacterota bacterium]|tara:strand:+ start:4833 stop:5675 length:843 start_codon:yes stop_codon:yes gene_type:complete